MSDMTLEEKIKRLIKEHSKDLRTQEQISSLSTTMMKNLLETALGAEMDGHLGYEGTPQMVMVPETAVTVLTKKPSKVILANLIWRPLVTERARLNLSLLRSVKHG